MILGLFSRLRRRPVEERATVADLNSRAFWRNLGGLSTAAGPNVNEQTAIAHSTVFACCKFYSENIAQLPLHLLKRTGERSKERAFSHSLYPVVHSIANPTASRPVTSYQARQMMIFSLMLHGNFLAFVERAGNGGVLGYHPLRWDRVEVRVEGREVVYIYTPETPGLQVERFSANEVWHVFGLSRDGLTGLSPIAVQREAVGHGLAMQEFGSRFFSNGARVAGVLQSEKEINQEGVDRLREQWNAMYQGAENANRVAVLEDGLKFQSISIPPEDAQWLGSRQFNREEIAGIYGIPGHMIGAVEGGQSFASIEQKALDFVIFNLQPTLVSIEQSGDRDLLLPSERSTYYLKHNVDALLRGDSKTRAEVHAVYLRNGVVDPNEVREVNDWNPRPNLDRTFVPLNMGLLNEDGTVEVISSSGAPSSITEPEPPAQRRRPARSEVRATQKSNSDRRALVAASYRPALEDAFARLIRAEIRETKKIAAKQLLAGDPQTFLDEVRPRYAQEGEVGVMALRSLAPSSLGLSRAIFDLAAEEIDEETDREGIENYVTGVAVATAGRYALASLRALEHAFTPVEGEPDDPQAALDRLFGKWTSERPERAARRESVAISRAASKEAYRRSGVTVLRWVARGEETCPFCSRLDGKVAAIEGVFVQEGEVFEADGRSPLAPRSSIGHPPLHAGCDCEIEPA